MTDQRNTPVISDETEELRLENERLFRNNQDIKEENRRKHVLVIDDDPIMLKVVKEHLHEKYPSK